MAAGVQPAGLARIEARVADLQARFAPPAPAGFAEALEDAVRAEGVREEGGGPRIDEAPAGPAAPAAPAAPVATPAAPGPAMGAAGSWGAAADWQARLPEAGQRWAGEIRGAAEAVGVDPALLAALVQHESGFRPDAVSPAGAIGLAQLMPGTAIELGVDPRDPQENLAGGARYLRAQLDRFGDVDLALAAYNAGPSRVAQAGGVPQIAETRAYVDRVTQTYAQLR